ncbi:unnamed protein product [Amaranthus hypochondriacus]
MAVSMGAGTAVILTLSSPPPPPPPYDTTFRRRFVNLNAKSSRIFGVSRTLRCSNFRVFSISEGSSQGDFYGSSNDVSLTPPSAITFAKGLLKFVISNLLPLALVGGVALGFSSPVLGCLAHKYSLSKFITCWLFFLSGKFFHVVLNYVFVSFFVVLC